MKSPRKIALFTTFAFLLALILSAPGCAKSESNQGSRVRQYTCPMHPGVVQDKPGKCPKCGMNLVEKR